MKPRPGAFMVERYIAEKSALFSYYADSPNRTRLARYFINGEGFTAIANDEKVSPGAIKASIHRECLAIVKWMDTR